MRILKKLFAVALTLAAALWTLNTSAFVDTIAARTKLIAHRGVHQTYAGQTRTNDTCKAGTIATPTHDFIENTLPSMRAAFDFGADVVELDVHLTTDGKMAVFHDWTLDCQTNGTGVTRQHSMQDLKALDLGYGHRTADGTTPFKGKGLGLMPSLSDVFAADLPGPVLINFKSRDAREGTHLAQMLQDPARMAQVWGVYGGAPPTRKLRSLHPDLRGYDRQSLKDCVLRYALIGWSTWVPKACQNTVVALPSDVAPFIWGWPHRFVARMRAANTDVIMLGPMDGSNYSTGIDTPQDFGRVPAGFDGYVWTNKIEIIGPLLQARSQ